MWAEVFSSDAKEFGGEGVTNGRKIKTVDEPMHGCQQSVSLTLPGNSVFFLECVEKIPKKERPAALPVPKKPEAKQAPKPRAAGVQAP